MNLKRKFIAIILARGGSKGIKLKNLIKIKKKPLLNWTIDQCHKSKMISEVYVSTENKKIIKHIKKKKVNIIIRPKKLARDNSSSIDGIIHALKNLNKKDMKKNDIIFLQATSPIRYKNVLDNALEFFIKGNYDSVFSSLVIKDYYVWEKKNNKLKAHYNCKVRLPRQKLPKKFLENGSFYIFKKDKFIKEKNLFIGKRGTFPMTKTESFQLDDPEDQKIIEKLI